MATTANGYIAMGNDETPWSDEEWESFSKFAKLVGNIIIGRRTYDIMKSDNTFDELGNPFTVVVSKTMTSNDGNISIVRSPKEALEVLKEHNFTKALIAGGRMLNTSFMQENLVNDVYIDVEPLLFGEGIKLFSDSSFVARMKLINIKNLSRNVIQLHYEVLGYSL